MWVALNGLNLDLNPNYGPAGGPASVGAFLVPPNGLRGSHCGAAAFEGWLK